MKMKNIFACLSLLTSPLLFANFDPDIKLVEGMANYNDYLVAIEKNIIAVNTGVTEIKEMQSLLRNTATKSQALKNIYQRCSEKMTSEITSLEKKSYKLYVTKTKGHVYKKLNSLLLNVEKYKEHKQQLSYDPELQRKVLNETKDLIISAVRELKTNNLSYLRPSYFTGQISYSISCNFNELFTFDDDKEFKDLKGWSNYNHKYFAKLKPSQIISGDYLETLEFIAKELPYDVERNGNALGDAKSKNTGRKIELNLIYDHSFITGYDNVDHPQITNPIEIIKRDQF